MNSSASRPALYQYVQQLIADIQESANNLDWPFYESELNFDDWETPEEEELSAPVRNLSTWTRIREEMLPPSAMLTDVEVEMILSALLRLLDASNCSAVFQFTVPERIQYDAIRQNFNQEVKQRRWHYGFFEFCKPGTPLNSCVLGEYCQCAFYYEITKDFVDEDFFSEEE